MDYELVEEGFVLGQKKFQKYRHFKSGINVTIFQHSGPVIAGNIVIKTFAQDDAGLPHALEHLVFLGSDLYPKGFLDFAANKCLSNGTNAWTDQDHTVYTVNCSGKTGFLVFLPIFLDHILFPKLSNEAFTTEIHHIDGSGKDGGVLYCEMQTYENTMSCIAGRSFAKHIYGTSSQFSRETGGLLEEIRQSCSLKRCFEFHKEFYHPHNANIIIHGSVTIDEIANSLNDVLNKVSDTLSDQVPTNNFGKSVIQKPATEVTLESIIQSAVEFPSSCHNDPGCTMIGFKSYRLDQVINILAENAILDYLISHIDSPLKKALVLCDNPFSSDISYHRSMFPNTVIQLKLENTDTSRKEDLWNLFKTVLDEQKSIPPDLPKIRQILKKQLQEFTLDLENHDFEQLTAFASCAHIYETEIEGKLLSSFCNIQKNYDILLGESEYFWGNTIKQLVASICLVLTAVPSPELLNKLEHDEENRIQARVDELGSTKLEELSSTLKAAESVNNNVLPDSMFQSIPDPGYSGFEMFDLTTLLPVDPADATCHMSFHRVESSFLRFVFFFDTKQLDDKQKKLLSLLIKSWDCLSVSNDGVVLNKDELSALYLDTLIRHDVSFGLFGEQICFDFTFTCDQLEPALDLMKKCLLYRIADIKRVRESLQSLKAHVKTSKRCGYQTMQSVVHEKLFPDSTSGLNGIFAQDRTLGEITVEQACPILQSILSSIKSSDNLHLHIIANSENLQKLNRELIIETFSLSESFESADFSSRKCFLLNNEKLKSLAENNIVVTVPGEETSYFTSILPVSFPPYSRQDIIFRVFKAWFGHLDGTVARQIRGKGLAYSFYIDASSSEGCMTACLDMSTDIKAAVSSLKEVMTSLAEGGEASTLLMSQSSIELAKRSAFHSIVSSMSTPHKAAFKDMQIFHSKGERKSLKQISETLAEIRLDDFIGSEEGFCGQFCKKLVTEKDSIMIYVVPPNYVA